MQQGDSRGLPCQGQPGHQGLQPRRLPDIPAQPVMRDPDLLRCMDRWDYVLIGFAIGALSILIILVVGILLGWWLPDCGPYPWPKMYA